MQEFDADIGQITATRDDADADAPVPVHVLIPVIGVSSAVLWTAVVAAAREVIYVLH